MGPVGRLRRMQRQLTVKVQFMQHRIHAFVLLPLFIIISLCFLWPMLTTSPAYNPVCFISIGDFGTGSLEQKAVGHQMAEAAERHGAQFILSLGDNFYPRGVKDLEDSQFQNSFEDIYTERSLQVPWYITLGDHDHRGSVDALMDYSSRSNRWELPSPYYLKTVQLSALHSLDLIVTDSVGLEGAIVQNNESRRFEKDYNMSYVGAEAGRRQLEWLIDVLSKSRADWRIVVGHRPLQSCAERNRYPVEERLRELLLPILVKYGVHVYMHGHDHIGQHSVEQELVYVGNGVGGFGVHRAHAINITTWFRNDYLGFVIHKITPAYMEFKFKNHKGETMHKFTLKQDYLDI